MEKMSTYYTQLHQRCQYAKKLYGLTAAQIAKQSQIAKSTVQNQLKGHYKMDMEVVGAILALCPGISSDWLMRGQGEPAIAQITLSEILSRIEVLEGKNNNKP